MTTNPDKSPIFVVGTGRSGTTLLRMMLNAHSKIYLTHEASFYLMPVRKKKPEEWFRLYCKSYSFRLLKINPDEILKELSTMEGQKDKTDAFKATMKCKARHYGKSRYGDKTPLNSMHLKKIFSDFEDPRVIHIVRDPRSTVASLMRMPWAASSISLNSQYCDKQLKKIEP